MKPIFKDKIFFPKFYFRFLLWKSTDVKREINRIKISWLWHRYSKINNVSLKFIFHSHLFTVSPNLKGVYLSFRQISSEDCYPQIFMNLSQWSTSGNLRKNILFYTFQYISAISLSPSFGNRVGLHMNKPKFFQPRKLRQTFVEICQMVLEKMHTIYVVSFKFKHFNFDMSLLYDTK